MHKSTTSVNSSLNTLGDPKESSIENGMKAYRGHYRKIDENGNGYLLEQKHISYGYLPLKLLNFFSRVSSIYLLHMLLSNYTNLCSLN